MHLGKAFRKTLASSCARIIARVEAATVRCGFLFTAVSLHPVGGSIRAFRASSLQNAQMATTCSALNRGSPHLSRSAVRPVIRETDVTRGRVFHFSAPRHLFPAARREGRTRTAAKMTVPARTEQRWPGWGRPVCGLPASLAGRPLCSLTGYL